MLENVKLNTARGPQEEPIHHTTKLELQVHVWGLPKAEGHRISKRIAEKKLHRKNMRGSVRIMKKNILASQDCFQAHELFKRKSLFLHDWLVVSTHLKNISQIGNLVKIKNIWNHHLDELRSHHNIPWSKTPSTKQAKKRVAVQDLVGSSS